MSCPDLGQPDNGMIDCTFGDDGIASYQDTCRFSCADGYRLRGSTSRNCQSDGTWSGGIATCHRGKVTLLSKHSTFNEYAKLIIHCLLSYTNHVPLCGNSSELHLENLMFS